MTHTALFAATALLIIPAFAQETKPKEEASPAPKKEEAKPAETPATTPTLDFGDHSSSTITTKAWEASTAGKHAEVDGYVAKCIELYEAKALEMQKSLTEAAPKEKANEYWALNDVGTCYYIRGLSKEARGDKKAAIADYKTLVEKLSFAQCWDTKGWFWKPADAAKDKLKALEFDSLE
jgi:tetratricopeptide (TPR) repeat protein